MVNYLGKNLSGLIKKFVGPLVNSATLIKITPGSRTAGQLTGGTNPTTVSYPCKGFIAQKNLQHVSGTLVSDGSVVIVLLGDTINSGNTTPSVGDRIIIEGNTYQIAEDGVLDRDPSKATYSLVCRPL